AADKVLFLCVLTADSGTDLAMLQSVADKVGDRRVAGVALRAAFYLRTDRPGEAAKLLTQALARDNESTPSDRLLLALAQAKLGQKEAARAALADGVRRLEQEERVRKLQYRSVWNLGGWEQRIAEQQLRHEAERLIGGGR